MSISQIEIYGYGLTLESIAIYEAILYFATQEKSRNKSKEAHMPRMVQCLKLNLELEGLDKQPIPGELGKKVFENISKQAWKMFEEHFKMVMNEYRLNLMDPRTDEIFKQQVEQFLFSGMATKPEGYVEPKS